MNLQNLETRSSAPSAKKLYTGIAPIKIVAVNPTRKQIAELYDIDEEKVKEPNYFTDSSTRLDFWYKNHDSINTPLLGKFALFVSNQVRSSQSGKIQYIDDHSKTCWADNISDLAEANTRLSEYSKLNLKNVRECMRGEDDLYTLMKAYGNVDVNKNPFMLDDFSQLVKGNVSELREFFNHFNRLDGGVKVLMGVKEGQYQDVWNALFLSLHAKISDYVKGKINHPSYGYQNYIGGSLNLTEYVAGDEPKSNDSNQVEWDNTTDPFGDVTPISSPTSSTSFEDDLFG